MGGGIPKSIHTDLSRAPEYFIRSSDLHYFANKSLFYIINLAWDLFQFVQSM